MNRGKSEKTFRHSAQFLLFWGLTFSLLPIWSFDSNSKASQRKLTKAEEIYQCYKQGRDYRRIIEGATRHAAFEAGIEHAHNHRWRLRAALKGGILGLIVETLITEPLEKLLYPVEECKCDIKINDKYQIISLTENKKGLILENKRTSKRITFWPEESFYMKMETTPLQKKVGRREDQNSRAFSDTTYYFGYKVAISNQTNEYLMVVLYVSFDYPNPWPYFFKPWESQNIPFPDQAKGYTFTGVPVVTDEHRREKDPQHGTLQNLNAIIGEPTIIHWEINWE